MTINYSSIMKDIKTHVRDILRADNTLVSSILNISGGTSNAYNYIFANRPSDQRKGFSNPRIVIEGLLSPAFYGDNPDVTIQNDQITLQVTGWFDDTPWSTSTEAVDRIRTLLNATSFSLESGGAGTFQVTEEATEMDPDKDKTIQGRVVLEVNNLIATR